jgi:hypothetical protein
LFSATKENIFQELTQIKANIEQLIDVLDDEHLYFVLFTQLFCFEGKNRKTEFFWLQNSR